MLVLCAILWVITMGVVLYYQNKDLVETRERYRVR